METYRKFSFVCRSKSYGCFPAGDDYENRTSTIVKVLPGVNTTYQVNYTIVDDDALELDESFLVTLQVAPGDSRFTSRVGGNHTVVITDDALDRGKKIFCWGCGVVRTCMSIKWFH